MKQFIIIFSITMIAILVFSSFFGDKFSEPDYEKIADKITAKVVKKIESDKGLIPMGTGGGMLHDIKMMAISFQCKQEDDIPTIRKLLVYCVEEYLNAINNSQEVRPYLHNYPFTSNNIEIRLFMRTAQNGTVPQDSICGAASIKGKIKYYTNNVDGYTLNTIHQETYENALSLVQQDRK